MERLASALFRQHVRMNWDCQCARNRHWLLNRQPHSFVGSLHVYIYILGMVSSVFCIQLQFRVVSVHTCKCCSYCDIVYKSVLYPIVMFLKVMYMQHFMYYTVLVHKNVTVPNSLLCPLCFHKFLQQHLHMLFKTLSTILCHRNSASFHQLETCGWFVLNLGRYSIYTTFGILIP